MPDHHPDHQPDHRPEFLPRARLTEQLAQALAADIRQGRLAPGARLPTEAALSARYDVSRTVVREAVSQLKSLGLVASRQGSGVFVSAAGFSPLNFAAGSARSRAAVVQIVEVRRALEAEVAALAARRRRMVQLRRIRQAMKALDRAVAAGGDGVEEDVLFHRAIAEAAANPYLIETLDYLGQFLRDATRVTRANEARRDDFSRQVREEHETIVLAIEAGDALRAQAAASRHMDNAIARIEQADPAFWREEGGVLARRLLPQPRALKAQTPP